MSMVKGKAYNLSFFYPNGNYNPKVYQTFDPNSHALYTKNIYNKYIKISSLSFNLIYIKNCQIHLIRQTYDCKKITLMKKHMRTNIQSTNVNSRIIL